jgi:4-amino-4-deoxy-L-arabinose transferase-like glycosyltransferase
VFFFGGFLLFFFFLRLWLAGFGGIHPDEAYYWTWAQDLSLGYYDHPPMVAWLIAAGQWTVHVLVPASAIHAYPAFFAQVGLRLYPYFLTCVALPLVVARAIELTQKHPLGLLQMITLMTAPVFVFGPQIVTPDSPFFFAWALALFVNLRFLEERGPDAVPGDPTPFRWGLSVAAGVAFALAAYSKYSAILIAFLFVICGFGPLNALLAATVAALLLLPHGLWFLGRGIEKEAGVLFQLKNGLGLAARQPIDFKMIGDLFGTQVFLWTPVTLWLAFYLPLADLQRFFLPRKMRRPSGTLMLWASAPLAFFGLTALRRRAEANWPLIGVVPALVLVISKCFDRRKTLIVTIISHLAVSVAAVLLIFQAGWIADRVEANFPHAAEQLRKPSRLRDFTDWDRFQTLVFEATRRENLPVLVHTYQLLSGLLFYDAIAPLDERLGDRLKIWQEGSRPSQFNLSPRYSTREKPERYWLVTHGYIAPPSGCTLTQTIYKNLADEQPYNVMRCGF